MQPQTKLARSASSRRRLEVEDEEPHADVRQVRRRAARARLRHDDRQRAAARAAVVAAGRGDHRGADRRRRCTSSPRCPGVREDVTDIVLNLKEVRAQAARRRVEARAASRRRARRGHAPATSGRPERRDPQPRPRTSPRCRKDGELDMELTITHGPRLRARRAQQGRGRAGRHHPDRRDLLADPQGQLHGHQRARRPAAPTTTS